MTVLEARNLVVSLRRRRVLDGVDFTLEQGELVGLIGPNGAGKTTLARTLAGLQTFESGAVKIDGQPLASYARKALAQRLAYLPQGENISWNLSVEALVMLGRLPHHEPWRPPGDDDWRAVDHALTVTETEQFRRRPVTQLSGGERARVLLARALAGEPRILLADEPVANLDPYHRLEVMEHLAELAGGGTAVLVVLHDLTLATRFCGRLILLHNGRVAAAGDAESVTQPEQLENCFRIQAHHGHLPDGPFVIPTSRVTGPPPVTRSPADGDAR